MRVAALSSGSSGNCFYINNNHKSILIDAGISCKRVLNRLALLGENPEKIHGIFVSHEHADHVKGVDVLARRFNIPIFATAGTIRNSFLCSDETLINPIKDDETIKLGGMEIQAFSKKHDAAQPVSFAIRNGKMISVITDIGKACENVIGSVENSDFLIIESNHDLRMLEDWPYPYFLKEKIKSDRGHLSNLHAGLCVLEHAKSKLKNVVLAHLSEINNTPNMAFSTFSLLMKERLDLKPRISVSTRWENTPLFGI